MYNSPTKTGSCNFVLSLFSSFLIFTCSLSYAQNEIYKNYTVKDGLPSNTIYKAFQDSKGFIWFSTDAGVSRFDGSAYENFTSDDGLSDNEVFQVKEDSKGRIWFLTFNGKISYFFNEKIYNAENDSIIRKLRINGYLSSFFEDSKHNIWIGRSSKYASRIKPDGSILEYELPKVEIPAFKAIQLLEPYFFEHKKIECMSRYNFLNVTEERIAVTTEKIISYGTYNFAPFYYSANELYFYSDLGIERIIKGVREIVIPAGNISNLKNILSITVTKERDIWLTSLNDQTTLYKLKDGKYSVGKNTLKGKLVIYVFTDREKNTWFCTRGNGLYFESYSYQQTVSYNKSSGLPENQVNSVYMDEGKLLWIGFSNGKLSCYDGKQFTHYNASMFDRSINRIIQIVSDTSGNIFLATDEGVSVLLKYKSGFDKPRFLGINDYRYKTKPYYAKSLNRSKDGRINYLATGTYGYIEKKGNIFQLQPQWVIEFGKRYFAFFVDSKNNFWLSTNDGLIKYDGVYTTKVYNSDSWFKTRLSQIEELPDGNLLLASYGSGIALFDGTKISRIITTKDGLSSNTCNGFVIRNDTVYVATNKGITCFVCSKGAFNLVFNYNTNEGLISDKINYLALGENKIYAATPEGLSILPVKNETSNSLFLQTTIKHFSVNGVNQNLLNPIVIDYSKNHLQVHFKAPVFQHAELISYQFMLEGRENDWNETKNDNVEFYSLQPGEYTFKVRAKYGKVALGKISSMSFKITPPYWKTNWFRLLIAVMATALLLLVYLSRVKKIQQDAETVNRILQSEIKALRAQMNPHFVFNSLNSIQHFIFSNSKEEANEYLTEFARLIRMMLDHSQENFIAIPDEVEFIKLYLKLEQHRLSNKFSYKITYNDENAVNGLYIPSMVLQPFVENAILHGIAPKEDNGILSIHFEVNGNDLLCTVEDDGIGLKASKQAKVKSKHQSFAMRATDERINAINAANTINVSVKIIDLSSDKNKITGTRIELFFPGISKY